VSGAGRPDPAPIQPEAGGSPAEFEALLNAAVDAVVVIDERSRILRFNKAAETIFGYPASEVIGQPLQLLMAPTDARGHQTYMDRYLNTGRRRIIGIGREVIARRRDGSLFPCALSVGEARTASGKRFVGLMRDVTREKEAEEEALRHREQMMHVSRLTTMGEMAAAIAHEINQPLSAIATYTAACQRFLARGEEARDDIVAALREVSGQAHRAGQIIQRMRDFTRSRESLHKVVDIETLFEEIRPLAELDARANHVRLEVDIDPQSPLIDVDPVQIQQVILNLLRNGVDAMKGVDDGGRVLRLRAAGQADGGLHVAISDRGHGIPEGVRARLFNPFFTTKDTGMGMGLAISRSIISAHGGKLDCENNPDGGATFFFTIPAAAG